jgi:hypothetical protein
VAWGPEGQTIYFDTEYPNQESIDGYGHRLIEASVLTGKTLRVVYEYPDAFQITASPDLNHLTVGFGEQCYYGNPVYLFDLMTGTQLDVRDLVPQNTSLSRTCSLFSPHGSFITAVAGYTSARYAPERNLSFSDGTLLIILDSQGTIQGIIGEPEGPTTLQYQDCPGWQPDEQAIVFLGYGAHDNKYVMRYSLPDQQLTTLYKIGSGSNPEYYVYSPLIPSPEGTHIALTVTNDPYEERQVAVLYPDGNIYRILSPYRFGLYPLWVPPLADEGSD